MIGAAIVAAVLIYTAAAARLIWRAFMNPPHACDNQPGKATPEQESNRP